MKRVINGKKKTNKKMYHKKTMAKGGKMRDNNLANNYPPYDKITRGDVIAGRLGKDQMGGKNKMAKGGNMKKGQAYKMYEITKEGLNGQYSYYSDKQGKTIKADTREEILREIEKEKKMAKGGNMYAKGGMTEHGLKVGDKITADKGKNSIEIYNKSKREDGYVDLDAGERRTHKYAKGGAIDTAKSMWSKKNKRFRANMLEKVGYSSGVANDLSFEEWDSLEKGVHIRLATLFSNKKTSTMAKGGKTKSKQDPPVIRGYVDDEPYEYGDGGTMNCWCYEIGGL